MSNLTRWEPMREMMTLREAMDRLFDDAFTRPVSLGGVSTALPALDMLQTADEVIVKAALPGLKPEEVQLTVTDGVLSLRGEFKQEERKDATWHIREHRYGLFERSITLPVDVQSDKARAEFQNGVLTINLPKAEAVKPKTINIKVK